MAYKKWDKTHFFVVLCIQPFSYNMLRINFFHIVDLLKIWNDQLSHPKDAWKINSNSFGHNFPQYGYGKYQWDTDFKTLLSQNQIDYLRFLDHIQKNMYVSDTKIVWTVQAFHDCIDTSTRWSRVCKVYTLSDALGR